MADAELAQDVGTHPLGVLGEKNRLLAMSRPPWPAPVAAAPPARIRSDSSHRRTGVPARRANRTISGPGGGLTASAGNRPRRTRPIPQTTRLEAPFERTRMAIVRVMPLWSFPRCRLHNRRSRALLSRIGSYGPSTEWRRGLTL